MNELGIVIKKLIRSQGLTGQEVASLIGITPPNLSQIINGHAKPRQGTFSNLCKVLGNNKNDEKLLVDAFIRLKEGTPEAVPLDPEAYQRSEIERAERFLEVKAQSIAFKRSVARELDKASISYQQDHCERIYVTDFLIEHDGKRIALECKFNVQRDLSKAITIAGLLKEGLNCDIVYIVVPYLGEAEDPTQGNDDLLTVNSSELISKLNS